jgi:terpene synthase-like protein
MSELTLSELNILARSSGQSMRCRAVTPHPAYARISAANVEWVKRFELVSNDRALKKVADIGCGLLAAYTFPRASEEVVSIAADLYALLFIIDDRYVESSDEMLHVMEARFATYRDAVRTRKVPSGATPFQRAILNICNRSRVFANNPDCWSERFSRNLDTYFDGGIREQPYKRSPTKLLRLDEYRRIRILSVAVFPFLSIISLEGANLSANDFEHTTVARLDASAALIIAWANDVYSFTKETKDGDPMNLVKVLSAEFGLSIPAAMHAAVELYNAELSFFENEIATLNGVGGNIRNYVQGLDDFVHGSVTWHGLSARYT